MTEPQLNPNQQAASAKPYQADGAAVAGATGRSEEHTSELQSP